MMKKENEGMEEHLEELISNLDDEIINMLNTEIPRDLDVLESLNALLKWLRMVSLLDKQKIKQFYALAEELKSSIKLDDNKPIVLTKHNQYIFRNFVTNAIDIITEQALIIEKIKEEIDFVTNKGGLTDDNET